MAARCKELSEYQTFIQMAHDNEAAGMSCEDAVKKAVHDCVGENILKDFFNIHDQEVVSMLTAEWNMDDALAVARLEERELERKNFARFLLNDGKDVDYVVKATGLDVNDVLHLQGE